MHESALGEIHGARIAMYRNAMPGFGAPADEAAPSELDYERLWVRLSLTSQVVRFDSHVICPVFCFRRRQPPASFSFLFWS
jgi:hypothetical protein